ncbi:MAG TPA: hypothetical protein VG692_02200, partial [Gemmatimonadales bacterium]|nr:hypothetical protein [Gemmatimonadales bacterium]
DRRPDIPPALGLLIDKCLAKRAEDRWQSAVELLRHLEPLATPSGGSTPASVAPVAPRRARWAVPAIAAGAALAAAAFFLVRPRPVLIGMAGSQRQITFTGQVTGAAISPDGELLAFVADSGGGNRLMLQDLRGGRAILLARSARFDYPTWSADGSEIRCFTFDSARPVLLRIPRLGGPERGLAAPFWSALSPSGDQLAELRQGGSALVLRMMATGDSVSTPVEPGFWHSLPTWSRDGEWLAWSEAPQSGVALNRLVVFSARRRVATVVRQDSVALGAPGWDGDGRAIYFLRGQDRVVNLMRLPLDRQGKAAAPAELIRAGITAGLPQTYVAFQPPPSVSADGRLLVYAQRQEWANLAIAEVEEWRRERRYHPLTTGSASWEGTRLSPDQRSVAAERTETDGMSLQVIPLDGGGPREVGRLLGPGGLAWSPRGDQIVVAALDPDSGRGLGFFPVSGGPARRTARGAVGDTPEWIADTLIIVPRTGNRAMQYVNVGTGRVSPVPGLDTTGWMFYPRRSPEGRRVAFAWNEGGGRMTVNVLDAGGRLLPVATGLLNPLGWSQDGRTIYVGTSGYLADSSRVLAVAADGSGQRALATFPPNLEPADVTRDGRRVVLVVHEQRADAWSIQFPARR